jgi:hypothetical protein
MSNRIGSQEDRRNQKKEIHRQLKKTREQNYHVPLMMVSYCPVHGVMEKRPIGSACHE